MWVFWVRPGGLHQGPEIETTLSHVEISSVPTRGKQNKLVVICRKIDLSPPPSAVVDADLGFATLCEAGGGGGCCPSVGPSLEGEPAGVAVVLFTLRG